MEKQPIENSAEVQTEPVEVKTTKMSKFWGFVAKNFLALSILTAGAMVSGSFLYANVFEAKLGAQIDPGQIKPGAKVDVSVDDDPMIGNKNAKVTIIEFSDFQCPFCRSFWKDTYQQIKKEYVDTGKVKFVYRDFPLSFHPMAMPSAQASECADEQGKFWEMHDKMFSEQGKLGQGTVTYTVNDLKLWAVSLGLDSGKFNSCLDSGKYKTEIEKDMADGTTAGVTGTPSLFINGRLVVGAQPFANFKAIIDEELKK